MLSDLLSRVSASDLLAIACLASAMYGASLLHPAAPFFVLSLACGFVAVELGKREAARKRQE